MCSWLGRFYNAGERAGVAGVAHRKNVDRVADMKLLNNLTFRRVLNVHMTAITYDIHWPLESHRCQGG